MAHTISTHLDVNFDDLSKLSKQYTSINLNLKRTQRFLIELLPVSLNTLTVWLFTFTVRLFVRAVAKNKINEEILYYSWFNLLQKNKINKAADFYKTIYTIKEVVEDEILREKILGKRISEKQIQYFLEETEAFLEDVHDLMAIVPSLHHILELFTQADSLPDFEDLVAQSEEW